MRPPGAFIVTATQPVVAAEWGRVFGNAARAALLAVIVVHVPVAGGRSETAQDSRLAQVQSPQQVKPEDQVHPASGGTVRRPNVTPRAQIDPRTVAEPERATSAVHAPGLAPPLSREGALIKQRVESLLKTGDIETSRTVFNSYVAAAPVASERATLSLSYANSLARAATALDQPVLLDEASTYLRYAFENGAQREQVVARNNYAAIALQQGRIVEGLATLREGYTVARDLPDDAARARYLFNFAKAVERHGPAESALTLYQEAYQADPRYVRAAEDGIDAAARAMDPPAAAGLLGDLIQNGQLVVAQAKFRTLIQQRDLAAEPNFTEVVEVIYELFPAAQVTPELFAKQWQGILEENRSRLSPGARARLDLVLRAYADGFPTVFISPEARSRYTPWVGDPTDSNAAAQVLARPSQFLTGVGDIYANGGKFDHALALYATAWALDTSNLTAGLYAANLLLEYSDRLDPRSRYMDEFIVNLFEGKGKAYLGDDLPNILRFHTILGTIFSEQERWGDSNTVRSAIFQWEHALRASERLLRAGRTEEGAAPGLFVKLAGAYGAVGRQSDAFDSYLRAASEALAFGNDELAREIVFDQIRTLPYSPSRAQRESLSALQRRLSG